MQFIMRIKKSKGRRRKNNQLKVISCFAVFGVMSVTLMEKKIKIYHITYYQSI